MEAFSIRRQDSVPDDALSRLQAGDLLSLEYHWGSAYRISVVDGRWQAVSRDGRDRTLTAPDAPALRDAIRRDYPGQHEGCSL